MNCERVGNLLVDYLEGSLGERKLRSVREHLSECATCRKELSRIEGLRDNILSLECPERDSEFWSRFEASLSRRLAEVDAGASGRPVPWPRLLPLAAVAAGLVALLTVSLLILGRTGGPDRVSPQLARETAGPATVEQEVSALEDFEDVDLGIVAVQAELSSGYLEQEAEEMFLLVEEDLLATEEDMVLAGVYEPSIYDLLEDLSEEDLAEVFDGLASI